MYETELTAKQPAVETVFVKNSLTVIHAFGQYRRGDVIDEPDEIINILSGGNAPCVVKTFS